MDYLNIIAYIFSYGALAGSFFWGARILFMYMQNIKEVEAIRMQEAKGAVLRMLLKAKLKKHVLSIENEFRNDKFFLDLIKAKTDEIEHFDFVKSTDYEKVLASMLEIYEILEVELHKRSPTLFKKIDSQEAGIVEQKKIHWYKIAKYGKAQLLLIRDIVEASEKLIKMIEHYHGADHGRFKNKFTAPDAIVIKDVELISTVLESMNDEENIDLDQRKVA